LALFAAVTDDVFISYYRPPLVRMRQFLGSDSEFYQNVRQRLFKAMRTRGGVILPAGCDPHIVAERRDVWTYGVYLAALFFDMNQLLNKVDVCPWTGKKGLSLGNPHLSGLAVAISWIPEAGLAWLWQDQDLWSELIAILSGKAGKGSDSDILRIIFSTEEETLPTTPSQAYFDTSTIGNIPASKSFPDEPSINNDEANSGKEMHLNDNKKHSVPTKVINEPFVNWLKEQLENGEIKTGENELVCPTENGWLLKSPDIFRVFTKETDEDWQRAQNRFLRKKLHLKHEDGSNFHRNGKSRGILLKKDSDVVRYIGLNDMSGD